MTLMPLPKLGMEERIVRAHDDPVRGSEGVRVCEIRQDDLKALMEAAAWGQANRFVIGDPDAYLHAILHYSAAFYSIAMERGMKPSEVVDGIQHMERAARGLHALAVEKATT